MAPEILGVSEARHIQLKYNSLNAVSVYLWPTRLKRHVIWLHTPNIWCWDQHRKTAIDTSVQKWGKVGVAKEFSVWSRSGVPPDKDWKFLDWIPRSGMTEDLLHDFWLPPLSPWLHSLIHPSFLHHRKHVLPVSFLSLLPVSRKSGVQWPLFILHHLYPCEYLCWCNSQIFLDILWGSLEFTPLHRATIT